jgi:Flp pilus assembly protein TadB
MTYLAVLLRGPEDVFGSFGLWAFLSVGAVALFGVFLPITTWIEARRKEREAYYKAETMRRVAESSATSGSQASVEYLREMNRMAQFRTIEGLKIGGVIMIAVGIGVFGLLWFVAGHDVAMCGLIPGLIGMAMLVYVYMLAPPVN